MTNIESAATGLVTAQQGSLRSAIGYAVVAKQLEAQQQQGQAAASLLETAVQLSKELGKGGHFDSQA